MAGLLITAILLTAVHNYKITNDTPDFLPHPIPLQGRGEAV